MTNKIIVKDYKGNDVEFDYSECFKYGYHNYSKNHQIIVLIDSNIELREKITELMHAIDTVLQPEWPRIDHYIPDGWEVAIYHKPLEVIEKGIQSEE
jgi:hypothetical protein